MSAVEFEVSGDGERVLVVADCGPLVSPHAVWVPLAEVEAVVARARAAQLGVDVWGNL
jgi:hypothetical protein